VRTAVFTPYYKIEAEKDYRNCTNYWGVQFDKDRIYYVYSTYSGTNLYLGISDAYSGQVLLNQEVYLNNVKHVYSYAFLLKDNLLALSSAYPSSQKSVVSLWDSATLKLGATLELETDGIVKCLDIHDGKLVACVGNQSFHRLQIDNI
jgi:hypothetical protein